MWLVVFFLFLVKICFGCVCVCGRVCLFFALANFDSFVDGRGLSQGLRVGVYVDFGSLGRMITDF